MPAREEREAASRAAHEARQLEIQFRKAVNVHRKGLRLQLPISAGEYPDEDGDDFNRQELNHRKQLATTLAQTVCSSGGSGCKREEDLEELNGSELYGGRSLRRSQSKAFAQGAGLTGKGKKAGSSTI